MSKVRENAFRRALPGWAGVLMAAHAPLISGPFSAVGSVAGALVAIVGGVWISLGALRGIPGHDGAQMPRAR